MSFTLNQLETFVLVAQYGSFSATARKLRKAQSAVSTTIANLEIELDLELFDRTGKSPKLTIEGRTFLESAESLLRQRQSLEDLANTLSLGLESRLNILVDPAVPTELVADALGTLEEQFPQMKVDLLRPVSETGLNYIKDGRADIAIIPAVARYSSDISFKRLGDVPFANVAPTAHSLTRYKTVTFIQLHSHRQLVYTPHSGRLPTGEYLHSGKSWYFDSYSLLLYFLGRGLGWASCPKHLIKNQLAEGRLVELDLEAYPVTEWLVGLDVIWSTGKKTGVAATWLRQQLVATPKSELLNTARSSV